MEGTWRFGEGGRTGRGREGRAMGGHRKMEGIREGTDRHGTAKRSHGKMG